MALEFIDPEEVQGKKGTRKKGERYGAYTKGIAEHVDDIIDQINNTGKAVVSTKQIAQLIGKPKNDDKSIYWGMKYVMWKHGVAVDSGTGANDTNVLIFRKPAEGEELPDSLKDKE